MPETVTAAVQYLESQTFQDDLEVVEGVVHCRRCGGAHHPSRLVIHHTFRFEGDTDPGDEAIVLGVICPICGARGVIVSAYGPDADADFLTWLRHLSE